MTDVPFSSASPRLITGEVNAEYGFAFNCAEPRGVKILSQRVANRLAAISKNNSVPNTEKVCDPADRVLYKHGLLTENLKYYPNEETEGIEANALNVWFHVTDACNLGCHYCYIPELLKHLPNDESTAEPFSVDFEKGKALIDNLVSRCRSANLSRLYIKFAGGEPTLAINTIDKLCEYAKQVSGDVIVSFGMISNGISIPEQVCDVLIKHRFSISISIDGMRDSHDRIRYKKVDSERVGTWDDVTKNAVRLRDRGIKPYFLFTLTQKNVGDLYGLSEFIHSELASGFRISLERGARPVKHELQEKVLSTLRDCYFKLAHSAPTDIRFDRHAKFAEWTLNKKKRIACSSCRGYFALNRVGDVSSCQMRMDKPLGNVFADGWEQIVDVSGKRDDTKLLRFPDKKAGACQRCEFKCVCAGGCPQHTVNVFGTVDHTSPWCFVYGSFLPAYIKANAIHMGRRFNSLNHRQD